MTTTVTSTIKSSGGDYTTITAWEAAKQGNLVSLDTIQQAECYSFALTDTVGIAGWTTGVNNYVRIYTPAAERHNGTSRDVSGIGFQMTSTLHGINVQTDYVRIDGLVIKSTNATAQCINPSAATLTPITNELRIENCILICTVSGSTSAMVTSPDLDCNLIMRNCIVYGPRRGLGVSGLASVEVSHCTINVTGDNGIRYGASTGTFTIKNNFVGGTLTEDFNLVAGSTPTLVGDHNASEDASADDEFPTGALINLAIGNQFTTTDNYTLKAGNVLGGAGTPLAAVTLDIVGTTRSLTAPAIGAHETTLVRGLDAPTAVISDVSNYPSTWTTEANARNNLYQSINEFTADDSTFIQSESYPVASVVSFSLSDPAVALGTGTGRVRIRYYKQSAEVVNLTVRLMQGLTVIKSWTYTNIGVDVVQTDETLTAPEVATITDTTALTLQYEASWTP